MRHPLHGWRDTGLVTCDRKRNTDFFPFSHLVCVITSGYLGNTASLFDTSATCSAFEYEVRSRFSKTKALAA